MMRQYRKVRRGLPDRTILFFRLGDFYEMFFDDAKEASRVLDIALTKRQNIPMCGVPHHAMDGYMAKLVRAGFKVAICDQVEDASAAKGLVRREVTRVVTPGTITAESALPADQNNYLASMIMHGESGALAYFDLSTGSFWVERLASMNAAVDSLHRISPRECVVPSEQVARIVSADGELRDIVTPYEDWAFDLDCAKDFLTRHFAVQSLEGFGLEDDPALIGVAGGVLHYVREELRHTIAHVRSLRVRNTSEFLILDETTCTNLDLVPIRGKSKAVTLLGILDVTCTAMGGRMLRDWLLHPLLEADRIRERHDALAALIDDRGLLTHLREELSDIRDLERLIARLGAGGGNARDLKSLGQSLAQFPSLAVRIADQEAVLLLQIAGAIKPMPELQEWIERAIDAEPPIGLKDGGLIREGYHAGLDELRAAATEGRQWLAEYQASEQERTGIKTIKVRHNKVFGYYIEVSKGQSDRVPEDYVRKQTLTNAERYITPQLKEYENKIVGAHDKAVALEYELFVEVRDGAVAETDGIQASADALARLDVVCALAERAGALRLVRPEMTEGDTLRIEQGRHPVVEAMPDAEKFVPNDTLLDCRENQIAIITGPNMAGKSTYIRQVALITVMAHVGSYVPAKSAEIGLVDRVFTRVGASDDLARGRSTFMVEMQETANILNNATRRSLIVLDEIGRGTSTFDGISIAWAVAEYLHGVDTMRAKTLFATHYHELTDLERTMDGVKNYNVLVRERNDEVVFLRRIVAGGADKSYGIQVARLAGLPMQVVDRAKEILRNLEEGELNETGQPKLARTRARKDRFDPDQLNLFEP
jgi:DNA mismatch repair protein MutS